MREIPLTRGFTALVDDEDYESLIKHRWFTLTTSPPPCRWIYAMARLHGRRTLMHRLLTQAPEGMFVDHIDGNGLNNQRANLRLVTPAQNSANHRPFRTNTSGYRGVCRTAKGRWRAQAHLDGKQRTIGDFKAPAEAAAAYDRFVARHRGSYGHKNGEVTNG